MSLVLQSTGGGQITIQEPATASNFTQTLPAADGTILTTGSPQSGGVVQVISANNSVFTSTTSTSFVSTGASASITPKFSTSRILILVNSNVYGTTYQTNLTILRNSTNLGGSAGLNIANNNGFWISTSMSYLDSPATTSSTTYSVSWRSTSGSTSFFGGDGSQPTVITLMEIAA